MSFSPESHHGTNRTTEQTDQGAAAQECSREGTAPAPAPEGSGRRSSDEATAGKYYGCVGGASQCPNHSVNSTSAWEIKKMALKTGFHREPESPKANSAVIPNIRIHRHRADRWCSCRITRHFAVLNKAEQEGRWRDEGTTGGSTGRSETWNKRGWCSGRLTPVMLEQLHFIDGRDQSGGIIRRRGFDCLLRKHDGNRSLRPTDMVDAHRLQQDLFAG